MAEPKIERDEQDGRHWLRFRGNVDSETSSIFERTLEDVVKCRPASLLLDFENVSCMNSTAFGLLMAVCHQVRQYGGRVTFTKIHPRLQAVFDLLRLSKWQDDDEGLADVPSRL